MNGMRPYRASTKRLSPAANCLVRIVSHADLGLLRPMKTSRKKMVVEGIRNPTVRDV